jgi:hypothetical protein
MFYKIKVWLATTQSEVSTPLRSPVLAHTEDGEGGLQKGMTHQRLRRLSLLGKDPHLLHDSKGAS